MPSHILCMHVGSAAATLQLGPSRPPALLTGITHCILAFLFLERRRHGASSDALRRFFYYFDAYATLVVWKARSPQDPSVV